MLAAVIVTIASFKGGVGKTTTAVHVAAYLTRNAPTVLVDGDANRSATAWARAGSLPYPIIDERRIAKASRQYEHLVIDTQARPTPDDLRALVDGGDLLVIPSTPDALALDALMQTVEALDKLGSDRYRILLTIIPPPPSKDGEEARAMLERARLPSFRRGVRRLAAFTKAALAGRLVSEVPDPRAELGWQDYEAVGKELLS
jgi:chromosome partitioning protein